MNESKKYKELRFSIIECGMNLYYAYNTEVLAMTKVDIDKDRENQIVNNSIKLLNTSQELITGSYMNDEISDIEYSLLLIIVEHTLHTIDNTRDMFNKGQRIVLDYHQKLTK